MKSGQCPPQTYEHREGIRNGFRSQNELAAQHESFDKFDSERLSSSSHERKYRMDKESALIMKY